MKLEDLPPRVRKKIDAASQPGCWIWTACVKPAQQRVRPYHHSNMPGDHRRNYSHFRTREKTVPMCHDPYVGYAVPAYRYIFALSLGTTVTQVPRLSRCAHELCVNPDHCLPIEDYGKLAERRSAQPGSPNMARLPETASPEDILTRLKIVRPSLYLPPAAAAEEANCPIPDADTWAAYVAWDAGELDPEAEAKIGGVSSPEDESSEDVLTRLKAVRPAPYLSPESAAEEANCSVPDPDTWAAYIAWDADQPEYEEVE